MNTHLVKRKDRKHDVLIGLMVKKWLKCGMSKKENGAIIFEHNESS